MSFFGCPICKKTSDSRSDLYKHLRTHPETYPCTQCEACYTTDKFLRKHVVTHDEKSFAQCPIASCRKIIGCQKALNRHIKIMHNGAKQLFACTEENCELRFDRQFDLNLHIKHDHTEGVFHCPFEDCIAAFTNKDQLPTHLKLYHRNAFTCVCGEKFQNHSLMIECLHTHDENRIPCLIKGCLTTIKNRYLGAYKNTTS